MKIVYVIVDNTPVVDDLIAKKIVVGVPTLGDRVLVARYGTNKKTLEKIATRQVDPKTGRR